ncbi:tyrosine-type recombinase/integrase [Segetibacter koreensis]|uniref:tyrosine-type recombinase/integrase n=1 Tax=Segetibacter koreensis TaxID=398037 RepID=UPI0003612D7A|nr:site-specific integrase [Segetibacter koreensis]
MEKILLRLDLINHKGHERVIAYCDYCTVLNKILKEIPGAKFSITYRSWHFPPVKEIVDILKEKIRGIAELDVQPLREKLLAKKQLPVMVQSQLIKQDAVEFSANNLQALQRFIETLILKAYSRSTIRTYRNEFSQLLKEIQDIPVQNLTVDHIRRYIFYCFNKYKISEATANSRINAIKFYFEQVLGRERMLIELPRPKKPLHLPRVLGENELSRLFRSIINLKHKAILFTAYSAGLRVSEVMNLRLQDVDSDRMQPFIKCSKGKKDRYVTLSPILLDVLRAYILKCKPRPIKFLFESNEAGMPYCARSAQKIFQTARQSAGIKKEVSFHSLRHSFATHLLEKGIDVIYIKDILGHFNIKTTERYLHVRKEQLVTIISPLDDLWKKGGIEI